MARGERGQSRRLVPSKPAQTSTQGMQTSRRIDKLLRRITLPQDEFDLKPMEEISRSFPKTLLFQDFLFMRALQPYLTKARTSEEFKALLTATRSRSKEAIVQEALSWSTVTSTPDVHIVNDSSQLADALKGHIRLIYAQASASITRSSPNLDFNTLALSIQGHDVPNGQEVFADTFLGAGCPPTNFLDLQNNTEFTFFPREILQVDLVYLIKRKELREIQKEAGRCQSSQLLPDPEWLLATHGPLPSVFHIDAAGVCTATTMVIGVKHWLVPKGAPRDFQRRMALKGGRLNTFDGEVTNIKLEPGSVLIQGPGVPHAVFSPGDCLLAGYFFWTAETFAETLQCLLLHEDLANDSIKVDQWQKLQKIVDRLEDEELFNQDQRYRISSVMMEHAEKLGMKPKLKLGNQIQYKVDTKSIRTRKDPQQSSEEALEEKKFLQKCAFWLCTRLNDGQ